MAGPGGREIGRVSLRVVPDLSTFKADVDAAIARIDTTIKVSVHVDDAVAQEQLKSIAEQQRKLDGDTATVKVKADKSLLDTVSQLGLAVVAVKGLRDGFSAISGSGAGGFPDLSFGAGRVAEKITALTAAATSAVSVVGPLVGLAGGLGVAFAGAAAGAVLLKEAVGPQLTAQAKAGIAGLQTQLQGLADKLGVTSQLSKTMTATFGTLHGLVGLLGPTLQAMGTQVAGLQAQFDAFAKNNLGPFLKELPGIINQATGPLGQIAFNIGGTLTNALSELTIVMGPALQALGALTSGLKNAAGGDVFNTWLLQLEPLIAALVPALTALGGAFTSLIGSATGLAGPVLSVITELGTALKTLFQSDNFRTFVDDIGNALLGLLPLLGELGTDLGLVFATFGNQIVQLMPVVVPLLGALAGMFAQVLVGLSPLLAPLLSLVGVISSFIPPLYAMVMAFKDGLLPVFPALVDAVAASLPAFVQITVAIAQTAPAFSQLLIAIAPLIPLLVSAMVPAFQAVSLAVQGLSDVLTPVVNFLAGMGVNLTNLVDLIGGAVIGFKAWEFATAAAAVAQGIATAAMAIFVYEADAATVSTVLLADGQKAAAVAARVFAVAQAALNLVMDANPIALIVIGIAALAAGLIYAYKHSQTFRDIIADIGQVGLTVWHALGDAFQWAKQHIDELVLALPLLLGPFGLVIAVVVEVVRHFSDIVGFFKALPGEVGGALSSFVDAVGHAFSAVGDAVLGGLKAIPGLALDAIKGLGSLLLVQLKEAGHLAITGLSDAIVAGLTVVVAVFYEFPKLVLQALMSLPGIVASAFDAVVSFAQSLPGRIAVALVELGTLLVGVAQQAWTAFVVWSVTTALQVISFAESLPGRIWGALLSLVDLVGGIAQQAWTAFEVWAVTTALRVVNFAVGLPGQIAGALSSLGGAIGGIAAQAWDWFVTTSINKAVEIIGFVQGMPGRIVSALGNLGSMLYSAGRDIIGGLIRGIEDAAGSLIGAVASQVTDKLPGFVKDALGIHSPSTVFAEIGKNIVEGLAEGIASTAPKATAAMSSLTDSLDIAGMNVPGPAGTAYVMSQLSSSQQTSGRGVSISIGTVQQGEVVPEKVVEALTQYDALHPAW